MYAFEIAFLLANGKQTDGFHIPGRIKNYHETSQPDIPNTNPDFIGEGSSAPYWKIYNTGSVSGFSPEYEPTNNYKGPHQYGEFAYWESTEEYPCNEDVWGDLAGEKIRHHKFPDVLVSPIIESKVYGGNMQMGDVAVFPIGVKIDVQQIKSLIATSSLSNSEKEDIVGFKILRGDRGTNKSIVAKGLLRNVNKYTKEEQDYYFPNYPYNDLGEDPFINAVNNAWTEQCEEYTIEILSLPEQPDGKSYVEIEYQSCENNKRTSRTFDKAGVYQQCSTIRPTFLSQGVYDKMKHTHSGSVPKSNVDAIVYPN